MSSSWSQSLRDWRAGPWLGLLLVLVHHFGCHLAAFKQVSNLVPFPCVGWPVSVLSLRVYQSHLGASVLPGFSALRRYSPTVRQTPASRLFVWKKDLATASRSGIGGWSSFGRRIFLWFPPPPCFGSPLLYRRPSKFLPARFSSARARRGCRRCGSRPPLPRASHARPPVPGPRPPRRKPPFSSPANQGYSQGRGPAGPGFRRPRPGPP